jgi:hypothetical protein
MVAEFPVSVLVCKSPVVATVQVLALALHGLKIKVKFIKILLDMIIFRLKI